MRFKRVLLIFPEYQRNHFGQPSPPLGIAYLSRNLQEAGITCNVYDMSFHNFRQLTKEINKFRPDLIGISMMTFRYKDHYALAEKIKKAFPNVKIIVGGPHVSTLRLKMMEECPAVDYAIFMEGENALSELCLGKEFNEIEGLLCRNGKDILGDWKKNGIVHDLDEIYFPDFKGFELNKYLTKRIGILTSKGCPFSCMYCPVSLVIGRKFRVRGAKSVADEIEGHYRNGCMEIDILDDNFALIPERVYEICNEIKKRNLKGLEISVPQGFRVDKITPHMLEAMKEINVKRIGFGIESGSERILKVLKKGTDVKTNENAIKMACEFGFDIVLLFLIGAPYETKEDFQLSLDLAMKYPVFDAYFGHLIPFPHTELFDWVSRNGHFVKPPEQYLNDASSLDAEPVFYTDNMGFEERVELKRKANNISKIIHRKSVDRLLKNFGPLRKIASPIFSSKPFQDALHHNRIVRKTVAYAYRVLDRRNDF